MLPIFGLLQDKGGVQEAELYQVFNMGIGMIAIVASEKANAILRWFAARRQKAWLIGEVIRGSGLVRMV